ncbi:uncharacterized protein [Pseudorasbora parva]|uniref:uncharacterized protein isoform X3 n=1 Tax=Pseudorasbora parva TaxID=51549 RepID=UPI00351DE048
MKVTAGEDYWCRKKQLQRGLDFELGMDAPDISNQSTALSNLKSLLLHLCVTSADTQSVSAGLSRGCYWRFCSPAVFFI